MLIFPKVQLCLLLAVFSAAGSGIGQQATHWCGTSVQDQHILLQRQSQNKAAMHEHPVAFREIQYIPIKFHLIAESDGSNMVPKQRVLRQLCLLNEDFADLNLQFYIKDGFNYILSDEVYSNHADNETIMVSERDDNALNIFFPEDADPPNQTGLGQILGYYSPGRDWLVIDKNEIGKDGLTFTHEVGHFFSLSHPFVGWEPEPWEEAIHGNPVDQFLSPDGQTPVELASGNNCFNAGDEVCDTPADYLFGFGWNNCNFDLEVGDLNGILLDPDELLWMNYFFNCDADLFYFSDMQQQLIQEDLNSNRRSYLRTGFVPNLDPIESLPEAISPKEGQQISFFNSVSLSWTAVAGAEAYLLQVSLLPNFTGPFIAYDEVVSGTSQVLEGLEAGRTYYWRVRPFSAYRTCTDFSETYSFDTGTDISTQGNEQVSAFEVLQNPIRSNQSIQLKIQANEAFSAGLRLYNTQGQIAQEFGEPNIEAGENELNLPIGDLATGIYFLALDTDAGILTKSLLIRQ